MPIAKKLKGRGWERRCGARCAGGKGKRSRHRAPPSHPRTLSQPGPRSAPAASLVTGRGCAHCRLQCHWDRAAAPRHASFATLFAQRRRPASRTSRVVGSRASSQKRLRRCLPLLPELRQLQCPCARARALEFNAVAVGAPPPRLR